MSTTITTDSMMLNFVKSWSPTSKVVPTRTRTLLPLSAAATGNDGSSANACHQCISLYSILSALLHIHIGNGKWQVHPRVRFPKLTFLDHELGSPVYCNETRAFGILGQNCNLSHSSLGIAVPGGHRRLTCFFRSLPWPGELLHHAFYHQQQHQDPHLRTSGLHSKIF